MGTGVSTVMGHVIGCSMSLERVTKAVIPSVFQKKHGSQKKKEKEEEEANINHKEYTTVEGHHVWGLRHCPNRMNVLLFQGLF
jgi:uncharacterized protein YcsI (UPF0317 family)